MAAPKEIKLLSPFEVHGKLVTHIKIKEPKFGLYIELGDPYIIARNADGSMFPIENSDKIQRYLEKCIVDMDPIHLAELSLLDAMAVKAAFLDFFTQSPATSSEPATS